MKPTGPALTGLVLVPTSVHLLRPVIPVRAEYPNAGSHNRQVPHSRHRAEERSEVGGHNG